MRSLAQKPNEKLNPQFYGPYQIIERLGPMAYKLALPPTCRLHPIFHVCRLKKQQELPIGLSKERVLQAKPDQLLDIHTNPAGATEVLVKWLNLPDCENSWQLLTALKLQFPDSYLEDKTVLLGVASVRSRRQAKKKVYNSAFKLDQRCWHHDNNTGRFMSTTLFQKFRQYRMPEPKPFINHGVLAKPSDQNIISTSIWSNAIGAKHFIIHVFGHIGATPSKQNRQNTVEGDHRGGHSNGLHGLKKLHGLFEETSLSVTPNETVEEPVL
ncbi:hypothetical protein CR513_19717, partial [Mucuna pruriens]